MVLDYHHGAFRPRDPAPAACRPLRQDTLIQGTRTPGQQARHATHSRGRGSAGHLPYGEPLLPHLRPARPEPGGRCGRHGGRPLLQAFRHRLQEPRTSAREDPSPARQRPGRRFHHHPAARQDPLPAPCGAQQALDGVHQAQGMDHRREDRAGVHQERDHGDVPELHLLRQQRLRSGRRREDLLRQGGLHAQHRGKRDAHRNGQQADPL